MGEVVSANAHLSNDKLGIYSEFEVRTEQIIKNDATNNVVPGKSVFVDRIGGYVHYSNGQKVLYRIAGKDLPRVGSRYVLFLTKDKRSPNYKILTGYEFKADSIIPLDFEIAFNDFKGIGELNFLKAIHAKISQAAKR